MLPECTPELLASVCLKVNREALVDYGCASTCIYSSAVLLDVLEQLRVPAIPVRVWATVFNDTTMPVTLGGDGDGSRRVAAAPGAWHGHLAVVTENTWLIDPTLDQVNDSNSALHATPMVIEVTPAWLRGEEKIRVPTGPAGSEVRYWAFPGRGGFKSAPDWRPRRRRVTVNAVIQALLDEVG